VTLGASGDAIANRLGGVRAGRCHNPHGNLGLTPATRRD
jgi:hypothetical protein